MPHSVVAPHPILADCKSSANERAGTKPAEWVDCVFLDKLATVAPSSCARVAFIDLHFQILAFEPY